MVSFLVGISVIVAAFYGVFTYVWSRFAARGLQQRVLLWQLIGSVVLGVFFASMLPDLEWVLRILVCLVIALPVFSVMALLTAVLWLEDEESAVPSAVMTQDLRQHAEVLQQQIDGIEASIEELREEKRNWQRSHDEELFRSRQLDNEMQAWQSQGGLERIRGLKIEDWTRKNSLRSLDDLLHHQVQLQERMGQESGSDGEDPLRIQLLVVEREIIRRRMDQPIRELREIRERIDQLEAERNALGRELRKLTHPPSSTTDHHPLDLL